MNKRQQLIKEIESIRGSKLVTYITSDRLGINPDASMINPGDLREIYDHLNEIKTGTKTDLYIYSRGGASATAWALVNLFRERTSDFNVLVPFRAHSCATSIAIGANEIVMGKMAELGPIDPTISATVENKRMQISTEDMSSYISFLKDKFQIKKEKNTIEAFKQLTQTVTPLLVGRAYRSYIKSRDDATKLLGLHLTDQKKIKEITDHLVEKLYAHEHMINRKEAKEDIKLNVIYAGDDLEEKMWQLYLEYEDMLKLKEPYKDEPTTGADPRQIPIVAIESGNMSSKKIAKQFVKEVSLPPQFQSVNALPIISDQKAALLFPSGQSVQLAFEGQAVVIDRKFFDKTETITWETERWEQKDEKDKAK